MTPSTNPRVNSSPRGSFSTPARRSALGSGLAVTLCASHCRTRVSTSSTVGRPAMTFRDFWGARTGTSLRPPDALAKAMFRARYRSGVTRTVVRSSHDRPASPRPAARTAPPRHHRGRRGRAVVLVVVGVAAALAARTRGRRAAAREVGTAGAPDAGGRAARHPHRRGARAHGGPGGGARRDRGCGGRHGAAGGVPERGARHRAAGAHAVRRGVPGAAGRDHPARAGERARRGLGARVRPRDRRAVPRARGAPARRARPGAAVRRRAAPGRPRSGHLGDRGRAAPRPG